MDLNDIKQDEFERIESYINGQLSNEDTITFEKKLNEDDDFKSTVNDIRTVLTGIETQALKEQLNDFQKELEQNTEQTRTSESKIITLQWKKIAVAAALIIAAGSFWFIGGNSNDDLFAQYFKPDPGLPTTMSNSKNYEFDRAMVSYKRGEYELALSKWNELQESKPNNDTLNYFIGVAHLANKNENIAISFLEKALKNSEFTLATDAYYYLGLAYLKQGNIEKAKANFKRSKNDNSKVLLSKLND